MKMISLYSKALQFAVSGYSVIPIGKDKKPLITSWKQYQSKAASPEQIEAWWEKFPEANIGIVTGKVSGITVIDLDTKDGELLTPLEKFPDTFTVRTGNGGYHLYYAYYPGLTVSAGQYPQFPGLDMRSDGGFVVAPYSVTDYLKDGKKSGGVYTVEKNIRPVAFPSSLFPKKKERRTLGSRIGVSSGGRNDSIASFAGQLLQAASEKEWETEVWDAVQRANKTYAPPLSERELKTTFESILNKERERRGKLIISPIQLAGGESIEISIRKNKSGVPYKDMANVVAVLSQHPYYKGTLRYNEFRHEIEYKGKPIDDSDIVKIQYFMQTDAELHTVTESSVKSAIQHYASQNRYDEVREWLTGLEWDGVPRLFSWLNSAVGVPDDEYHRGIGSQWFMGMIRRIMLPGCTFDYVLLLIGAQGIGKTSLFRILGGPWYKSYTGAMDNKDFYLALRGALIMDLDEGAALYRSEAIKIKSIISETHDEFREPFGRVMKKYPRRFVFSMSTNDTEPFRDATGNRRYWVVDAPGGINFKWLEESREQLFAEAYALFKSNAKDVPEVPFLTAAENQEKHLPDDAWSDMVMEQLQKDTKYCRGDVDFSVTASEIYQKMFPEESMARFTQSQTMRLAAIFKKVAGLTRRQIQIEGRRAMRWVFTAERALELQNEHATSTRLPLEEEFDNLP